MNISFGRDTYQFHVSVGATATGTPHQWLRRRGHLPPFQSKTIVFALPSASLLFSFRSFFESAVRAPVRLSRLASRSRSADYPTGNSFNCSAFLYFILSYSFPFLAYHHLFWCFMLDTAVKLALDHSAKRGSETGVGVGDGREEVVRLPVFASACRYLRIPPE